MCDTVAGPNGAPNASAMIDEAKFATGKEGGGEQVCATSQRFGNKSATTNGMSCIEYARVSCACNDLPIPKMFVQLPCVYLWHWEDSSVAVCVW